MQASVDRIQAKAELAGDRQQLLGLLPGCSAQPYLCIPGTGQEADQEPVGPSSQGCPPCAVILLTPSNPALPRSALPCPTQPILAVTSCAALRCMIIPLLLVSSLQLHWYLCPKVLPNCGCCTHGWRSLMPLLQESCDFLACAASNLHLTSPKTII